MSWESRAKAIKVGDRVAYSAAFLRNTGQVTGDLPFARGIVMELKDLGGITLATIDWGDPEIPEKVAVGNLVRCTERGILES